MDFIIQWHLTDRCNLRCQHCYQAGEVRAEMTLPEIRRGIEEIAETLETWQDAYEMEFSPSFSITGGEPFLREDLFPILEEIRKAGYALHILTNGTILDQPAADRLAAIGVDGLQVSFEGPEAVHDRIRGRGSFSRALRGVERLAKAGLPVTANATISRLNRHCVSDLIRFLSAQGFEGRFGFSRLVPCGSGRDLLQEMLTAAEVRQLHQTLGGLSVPGLEIVTGDPLAADAPEDPEGDVPVGGCAAGFSGITIMPDGTLTPCRRLDIPIGNIRTDPFREVWALSPVLNRLRDKNLYGGRCGACDRWAACRGCRAIAYAFSGLQGKPDYLAEDPQCYHLSINN
jgi:radical SAM protein with 4Fe4S-binding SPASM domain